MLNFVPSVGVELSQTIVSASVQITQAQTLTITGGSLIVNGSSVTSPHAVIVNDLVAVSVTSSTSYSTPTFANVTSSVDSDVSTYFAITKVSGAYLEYPQLATKVPLDLTTYEDGSPYVPQTNADAYNIYSVGGVLQSSISLATVVPGAQQTPASYNVVIDYQTHTVFLFSDTNVLVAKKTYGVPIYGGTSTGNSADPLNNNSLIWITIPSQNKVIALDHTLTEVHNYMLGSVPRGLASFNPAQTNSQLVVCSSGDNKVLFVDSNTGAIKNTVTVGGSPFEVQVSANYAFVTLSDTAFVCAISLNTYTVTLVTLPHPGLGLTLNGNYAYALCADYVVRIDTNALTTSTLQIQGAFLYDATVLGTVLYVVDINNSKVWPINLGTFTAGSSFSVSPNPYAIAALGSNLAVGSFYPNSPTLMFVPDTVPTGFDIVAPVQVTRNTSLTTNSVLLDGVYPGVQIPVSVPSIYGATINKNGVAVGSATTAVQGDTISATFTTPVVGGVNLSIPVLMGTIYSTFTSTTAIVDVTPTAFTFTDLVSQTPNSFLISNEITITGVDTDAIVSINAPGATVYKNGVSLGTSFGSFVLNDKLKLGLQTPMLGCAATNVAVTAGTYTTVWTVTTAAQAGRFVLSQYLDTPLSDLPTIGTINTANDALAYIGSALTGSPTRSLLSTAPTNVLSSTVDYLAVFDKARRSLYLFNPSTNVVDKAYTAAGSDIPVSVDYYPKYSTAGTTPTHIAIVVSGTTNKLTLLDDSLVHLSDVTLTDVPSACCARSDGTFYIAFKIANRVSKYTVNGDTFTWVSDTTITAPDFLVEDPNNTSNMLVGSANTGVLTVFDGSMSVKTTIANIAAQGMAADPAGQNIYVADTFTNSIRVFSSTYTEGTRIILSGPPSDVAFDGTYLYVTDVVANTVTKYSTSGNLQLSSTFNHAPLGVAVTGSVVYVIECTSNLDLTGTTSALTQMTVPTIPFVDLAVRGSTVQSADFTVSGLVRPVDFYADPYVGVSVIKNHVDTLLTKVSVWNGDVLAVKQVAPSTYYTEQDLRVGACGVSTIYSIRSEPNLLPDLVFFASAYDQYVDMLSTSTTVTISGITPGFTTDLTFDFGTTTGAAYVNGVLTFTPTITVANGDTISLVVLVDGPYGALHYYALKRLTTTLGTYKVVTITLNGAQPWPIFATNTNTIGSICLEREQYVANTGAGTRDAITKVSVPAWASVVEPRKLYTVDALNLDAIYPTHIDQEFALSGPTYLVRPMGFGTPTLTSDDGVPIVRQQRLYDLGTWTNRLLHEEHTDLPPLNLYIYTPHLYDPPHLDPTVGPHQIPPPVMALGIYAPEVGNISEGTLAQGYPIVYGIEQSDMIDPTLTPPNWSMGSQEFVPDVLPGLNLGLQVFTYVTNVGPYFTDLLYMDPSSCTPRTVDQYYLMAEQPTIVYCSLDGTSLVYDILDTPVGAWNRAEPTYELMEPYVGFTSIPDYGNLLWDMNAQSLVATSYIVDGMPALHYVCVPHIADTYQSIKGMLAIYTYVVVGAQGMHNTQYLSGMGLGLADQDSVSWCPPYGSCVLKGMYPDMATAYAAAVVGSDGLRPLTAVPYQGCWLWIEDPVLVSKVCASVGPNDPWIIPYAWCLSEGPLKIARTQLKVNHYIQGG